MWSINHMLIGFLFVDVGQVLCQVCLFDKSLVMITVCEVLTSHYIPLHRVTTKSSLSTSFSTVHPTASEQQVYLDDPISNTGNWFHTLVLGSTYRLGIMAIQLKEYVKRTKATYLYLETHAQENKLWQDRRLSELTCVKEGSEGKSHAIGQINYMTTSIRYNSPSYLMIKVCSSQSH